MRFLVTGGGGYIGSVLVPTLLDRGHGVRVVDRFFFGRERLPQHPALDCVREDTRRIRPDLLDGVDVVIDLAALSNDPSGETFKEATWAINWRARARLARMARDAGVLRYILPSSCSVYGFQGPDVVIDETGDTHPLTTYAEANLRAEGDVLPLAGNDFTAVVTRLATVFGLSPRMRFDLAVNGMTVGARSTGRLPLMRDGTQYRPIVHVRDVADALIFLAQAPSEAVNGRIVNIGDNGLNYRLAALADDVIAALDLPVEREWYGDPDHRSYRVSFDRLNGLGFRTRRTVADGVREIVAALDEGKVARTPDTITLDWYKLLIEWRRRIKEVELHGGLLDI